MSVQYEPQFYMATMLRPMTVGTIVMHKSRQGTSVAKNALDRISQHHSLHDFRVM